jgi:hypothetical protein
MPSPYLPLWEGTQGSLSISNQPGAAGFSFPVLPEGGGVNYPAAVGLFQVSADNASWQGRVGIAANGSSGFNLTYNGSTTDPLIAVTNFTLIAQDIAWWNTGNNSSDPYQVNSSGGGSSYTIPIYWLVSPVVSNVSPSALRGDGNVYSVTVTLAKPMAPIQAACTAQFSCSGGATVQSSSFNYTTINGQNFVAGWTLQIKTPIVGSTTPISLSLTLSGTITYLSGTQIVTNNVTYINGQIASITLTGVAPTTASPETILNGWGSHVGDFENGTDQGHSWTLGAANAYTNPQSAIDGDASTFCSASYEHTHQYAGCIWSFSQYSGYTVTNGVVSVNSQIPATTPDGNVVNQRSAGIWYSLDGGFSWTNIYNTGPRGQTTDRFNLPNGQDPSLVQIMAFIDSHDDMSHYIYEISLTGIIIA